MTKWNMPSPSDVFTAVIILVVISWQAQVILTLVGLLFVLFTSHWIIGGLFWAAAFAAWRISKQLRF